MRRLILAAIVGMVTLLAGCAGFTERGDLVTVGECRRWADGRIVLSDVGEVCANRRGRP